MNQETLLLEIRKHLAILSEEIQIANANNEQSINIHVENILIPILNELYNCELYNANYHKERNYFSIDLFDKLEKYTFQITSTNTSTKLIQTISKYKAGSLHRTYKNLYILIIGKEKLNYNLATSSKIAEITNNEFDFDLSKNVIDFSDIYLLLNKNNNIDQIKKIRNILNTQFTEIKNEINNENDTNKFLEQYKKTILASSFKRISFLGLSTSKKPREIDIYSLFIKPKFSSSSLQSKYQKQFIIDHISPNTKDKEVKISELYKMNVSFDDMSADKIQIITKSIKNNFVINDNIFGNTLDFGKIFKKSKKAIILGRPGAGKSSFIKFSMCKILESDINAFSDKSILHYIPFRIELSEYHKNKKNTNEGFIKYLVRILCNSYHIDTFSEELFKYILKNNKSLMFFDGLDEIFDLSDRLTIRDEIKAFSDKYTNCKIFITSRYESNQEVPFSEDFETYEVLDFNDDQITEYIDKWYSIEESDDDIRETETASCKREVVKVSDELKRNPLLLSLIVILYRNDLVLPTSKLEIYESCTNTLIETRDNREKKLEITHKVTNISATFSDLAYWQFTASADKKSNNYTFDEVVNHVKYYLINKGECDDELQAFNAAVHFLDFAKLRSIYFENNFTHKTFLEYFTANYIFSSFYIKYANKESFYQIVTTNSGDSSWSIVIELLLSKIDRLQNDFEELDLILDKIQSSNDTKGLLFVLKILKYIKNISPTATKKFITNGFNLCINNFNSFKKIKETRLCFAYLMDLIYNPRFNNYCQISFDTIGLSLYNERKLLNYKIFYLEHLYSTINSQLKFEYNAKSTTVNDPYEFILTNFIKFQEDDYLFSSLKLFIELFGKEAACKNYQSFFASLVFNGESNFNWIVNTLFGHCDAKKIPNNYKLLKDIGFTSQQLIKATSRPRIRSRISKAELNKLIASTKDKTLITIINNYKDPYGNGSVFVSNEHKIQINFR